MNKRMISFLLTMVLVVATICQPIAAAPRVEDEQVVKAEKVAKAEAEEKTVNREKITEDEAQEAVIVSENEYKRVSVSQENPYAVYKFVPTETKEYFFFSSRKGGDPYVYVYQDEDLTTYIYREDDYENSEEDFGTDFGGKLELQKDVPYYFVTTTYNYAEDEEAGYAEYYFAITSDYSNRSEWIKNYYENKTAIAVSMNDLPRYEFLDVESDAIGAEISVYGIEVVTYFEDATEYKEYIYDAAGYECDEQDRVVATRFDTINNTYKVYWETLMEKEDGLLYMDNTVSSNSLCIEDKNGRVEKYPVVIKETDISNLEVKTAPTEVSDKILIYRNSNYAYDCGLPFSMDGLALTVTRKDGTKYDVTYHYYYDEDEEEDVYYFSCSENEEILPYDFALEKDENNQFCLGNNTLTVTYGGRSVEIPTFLYEMTKCTVLNRIAVKETIYPFNKNDHMYSVSLKGLKIQRNYSDGTSKIFEVTEDISNIYMDGYLAYGYASEDKVYLYSYYDRSTIEVGTYEKENKSISAYPGMKDLRLDASFDIKVERNKDRVVYRYTPDVTAQYRITSAPGDKSWGDPRVDVYTDTDDESVAYADDDNNMQFDLTVELKAGTTYYFVFKSYETPETFRVTFEAAKQLQQVITAPATIVKKMNDAPFAINAKVYGNVPITYTSSNPAVATVDAKGMVTIKSAGTTNITVSTAQTKSYTAAKRNIVLTVNKIPLQINAADTITKAYGSKKFSLNASSAGAMTYTSSNKKVATVDKNGKVTIKNCGKAVITIKATANGYLDAEKKVVIKVVPKKAKIKSLKSNKAGQITVKWSRQKEAKGYIIEYSTDKKFKKNVKSVKIKKNKTTSKTIKKLKKGKKYYVRVKAYVTIDKKTETGAASARKNVKIKK